MPLFSRKRPDRDEEPEVPTQPEPKKKDSKFGPPKKRSTFLKRIGIETDLPDERGGDRETIERDEMLKETWKYLRQRIDNAVHQYYRTGSFSDLEKYVERDSLAALKVQLAARREQNIYWSQPNRQNKTKPRLTIVAVDSNPSGTPQRFVVREMFSDYASYQKLSGSNLTPFRDAPGHERVLEATVNVHAGTDFKLHSIRRVREDLVA